MVTIAIYSNEEQYRNTREVLRRGGEDHEFICVEFEGLFSRDIKSGAQNRELELGYKFGIRRLQMVMEAQGADDISQGENIK